MTTQPYVQYVRVTADPGSGQLQVSEVLDQHDLTTPVDEPYHAAIYRSIHYQRYINLSSLYHSVEGHLYGTYRVNYLNIAEITDWIANRGPQFASGYLTQEQYRLWDKINVPSEYIPYPMGNVVTDPDVRPMILAQWEFNDVENYDLIVNNLMVMMRHYGGNVYVEFDMYPEAPR